MNKTYRAICDGQQEIMYLDRLAGLLTNRNPKNVKDQCVITFNSSKNKANLLKRERSSLITTAVLFDFDNDPKAFEESILTCIEENSRDKTVYAAYSSMCFDLWLVLHKEDYSKSVYNPDDYQSEVRKLYGLPKNADIKSRANIEKILDQISLADIKKAILRAEKLRTDAEQYRKPHDVSGKFNYYDNPDLSIQVFIRRLLELCHQW